MMTIMRMKKKRLSHNSLPLLKVTQKPKTRGSVECKHFSVSPIWYMFPYLDNVFYVTWVIHI